MNVEVGFRVGVLVDVNVVDFVGIGVFVGVEVITTFVVFVFIGVMDDI